MLTGGFMEAMKDEIVFPEIKSAVLEKVIQYMYYKIKHCRGHQPPPEFEIEPEMALYLLMVANYLDI